MYVLTYRKPLMIFITIIGITMLVGSLGYLFGFKDLFSDPPYVPGILGFVFVIVFPFSIYMGAKRSFSSNKMLIENINYEFTDKKILLTGESFISEMDWKNIYKILELKDWILIYQNRQVFNVIPKESFGKNLTDFKSMVRNNNIKSKLRK